MSTGKSRYKLGCVIVWVISFLLTVPIFYYSDVVIVGNDNSTDDRVCKVTWIHENREQCIRIINESISHDRCPHDQKQASRCSLQQKPLEKSYLVFIVAIAIVLPITGTIVAYFGLVSKVQAIG